MKSLSLSKPHLVVMVGVPGAGKSFFAEHFAETFKAPLVSWNKIRNELFNEPTYSKDEQAIIARVGDYLLEELLKTDKTVLYEGAVQTRTARQDIAKKAHAAGYETLFVWVQTDAQTTKTRSLKAGVPEPVYQVVTKTFTSLKETEPFVVISGKHTYASQLKIVLRKLSQPRTELVDEAAVHKRPAHTGRNILIR